MTPLDNVSWFALSAALTVAGAVATVLLWRRRGAASGLRTLAWTLLPGAAYLTGTLRLVGRVGDAVASWALGLVFNPFMWVGIALAGASAALFAVAAGLRRRGAGSRRRSVTTGPDRRPAPTAGGQPAAADDDMADIEAILKKHGIS